MTGTITYCDDCQPGITRRKVRGGWGYWGADGKRITDRDEIDRLNAIGLPPAYRDAWFCPDASGHIQAVGWDEKGRKQYRYHAGFREAQEAAKYSRCAVFGERLPRLRKQVERDLRARKLSRERAVAAVVRLLDRGQLRVGNEGYVKANNSFGATTLRRRHAKLTTSSLLLQYRAKSGKMRVLTITDGSLIRFVRRCQDLPGQHLFSWVDEAGEVRPVTSTDVNVYIREAMGEDFTAKHFRTWGASAIAFEALATADAPIGLKAMLEPVTEALGNTPAIARKSYVHPTLVALAKDKPAQLALRETLRLPRATRHLSRAERGLIALLKAEAEAADAGASPAPPRAA
ncbi:DNA topoisomerase IB [Sphingomonas baiyangensis]|uniref:DNA topoisomerase n=1 Tax=Sphingomonas baiyangensis TaxID=2572576 RepID=A0A4U1L617_9SPHN|nr:DNA topoisomerase IB [Sphingomonas baiyangensis]TKD51753.1 DNA topoisomerase IB [Sphingomonas baiyangensis]